MQSAGSVLKRLVPDLVVSKQKLRQAEGTGIVRLKREEGKQNLGFSSRPFVLCGLPVRKPPKNELLYERRNGNFVLQITGHPNYGRPFGQDRIVPIYLATLAVRQQSQTIRFRTAAEMLETFGMHKGGKEYRRLVAAFERIFGATIFFGTDALSGRAKVVQRSRFSFFREAQIWYSRDPDQCPLSDQFENVIVLSDEFYREITAHPIPADLEAVKLLAGAPAVLDLFMWLSYRCFVAKGQEAIPLLGPFGLASQIGSIEYARPRRFREKLDQWLDSIRVLWPECPAHISADGESLVVNRASAVLMEQKICG
ncbi:MAG: replication protein RepA [Bryobacteraceae bacterium]